MKLLKSILVTVAGVDANEAFSVNLQTLKK